jgi:hypothetical protein
MIRKPTRFGDSLPLVIEESRLEALRIGAGTGLEISTDGDVVVITPRRDPGRIRKLKAVAEEAHERYGGVFRRLAG